MNRKKFNKTWALGLILISIFIINLALKQNGIIIKLIGIFGAGLVIMIQSWYIYLSLNKGGKEKENGKEEEN